MPSLLSTVGLAPVPQAPTSRANARHAPKSCAAPQAARMGSGLGRPPLHTRSMESLKHRYAAVPGSHEGSTPAGAEQPSLAPVYAAVAVAGLGAFSFGYHLGVVNGPLAAIAADLGFAGNASLQGLVRRPPAAAAAAAWINEKATRGDSALSLEPRDFPSDLTLGPHPATTRAPRRW